MSKPHVVIVGAEKGGVGKSTVSRTLLDYFASHGISVRARDAEFPKGNLVRFHPDVTKVVNLEESDDQVEVFDHLNLAQVTLIDLRAALLTKSLAMLKEIGFLNSARQRISVLHVIGSNKASYDEIDATRDMIEGAKHHVVLNYTNKAKFLGLPASVVNPIIIPQLLEGAVEVIDHKSMGFQKYISDANESPVLTGYTRTWLGKVWAEYDKRELNAL